MSAWPSDTIVLRMLFHFVEHLSSSTGAADPRIAYGLNFVEKGDGAVSAPTHSTPVVYA